MYGSKTHHCRRTSSGAVANAANENVKSREAAPDGAMQATASIHVAFERGGASEEGT
jgi:hypothetical protein